jgi:hypothetical protein
MPILWRVESVPQPSVTISSEERDAPIPIAPIEHTSGHSDSAARQIISNERHHNDYAGFNVRHVRHPHPEYGVVSDKNKS